MDDKIELSSKLDEGGMIDDADGEMVSLDGMKANVGKPIVVLGIGNPEKSEMVCRDEEKKENDMEEMGDEEDPKEEVKNDGNPKEEANIEENDEDDVEEEVRNDDKKEEAIIEQSNEDDPEEEVKNEEDAVNDARNEGKLEAISKKKASKMRKKPKMLKKKKVALGKKVKNALVSTSKLDEDGWVGNVGTEMISLPMLDKNDIPIDVGTGVVLSEQNAIVGDVDNGAAISNPLKWNCVVLGDEEKKEYELGKVSNEENSKEKLQNELDTRNEAKAKEKLEANSKKKVNKKRGQKKQKVKSDNDVAVNNRGNPESSKKNTATKDKCMGMIFMCNSKTKKDCYHYQVLGLPASKRDIVFEIYEGMKLFLFDFDLKLMYGIYKAAGPGGYNIEPKAFNSAFPSQVRFSVLEDCVPLAEEKFKKIIKDNYYSKNKFDCQLNSKQVENLCELFRVASKRSTSKQLNGRQNAEALALLDLGPKRPPRGRKAKGISQAEARRPVDHEPKQPRRHRKPEIPRAEAPKVLDRKAKRPRRSRKAETRPFVDPKPKRLRRSPREESQNFLYGDRRHHGWEDERHRTLARDRLYLEDTVAYRREVYEPPLETHQPLHLPLASSLHPSSERNVYRRDQLHYRDVQPLDVDLRRQDEFDYRDSDINPLHRDDFNHRGSYLASRGHLSYPDPSFAAQPPEYYPPASRRPASAYNVSAAPPPEYQPYRPAYRY